MSQLITATQFCTTFFVFLNNFWPKDGSLQLKHVTVINNTHILVVLMVLYSFILTSIFPILKIL